MSESASSNSAHACPKCGTANSVVARFCVDCGEPLSTPPLPQPPPDPPAATAPAPLPSAAPGAPPAPSAPPPPPQTAQAPPPSAPLPPPSAPPPPPSQRGIDFSQFRAGIGGGIGAGKRVAIALDAAAAYDQIGAAIQAGRGMIEWQAPPQSARFTLDKKDFWNTGGTTVKYAGELTVTPTGPQTCMAQLDLKVNWSSMIPIVFAALGCAFLAVCMYQQFAGLLVPMALALVAYYVWMFASKVPNGIVARMLKGLPEAPMPVGGPAVDATPPPAPTAAPGPGPAPPPSGAAAGVADRIKQLAELRDAGAISPAEYEAKKAELLKQL